MGIGAASSAVPRARVHPLSPFLPCLWEFSFSYILPTIWAPPEHPLRRGTSWEHLCHLHGPVKLFRLIPLMMLESATWMCFPLSSAADLLGHPEVPNLLCAKR